MPSPGLAYLPDPEDYEGRLQGALPAYPGLANLFGGVVSHIANIPQRAFQASETYRQGGEYAPGPVLDAASLAMTGGIGGAGGGAALGSGPIRKGGIRAYHGSPHDFDKFDISKVGTGEGAQVYGHGLYFAENPKVAQQYKMESSLPLKYDGIKYGPYQESEKIPFSVRNGLDWLINTHRPGESSSQLIERRIGEIADHADFMRASASPQNRAAANMYDRAIEALKEIDPNKLQLQRGRMYEVNINARPEDFLNWDKPLSEQPRPVQYVLRGQTGTGGEAYNGLARAWGDYKVPAVREVSKRLLQSDIPGIRYLDQGSRGAGEGSHNYVVFDPSIIDILRKYGIAGLAALPAAGAYMNNQQTQ